ncbi:MAG TPA: CHASE2 domain-containing protein [Verrucomicrobiae bacterium]
MGKVECSSCMRTYSLMDAPGHDPGVTVTQGQTSTPVPPLPGTRHNVIYSDLGFVPHEGDWLHNSRYRLIKCLGKGGMGEVWLADDALLQRKIAIKLLPASMRRDQVAMENLHRETARGQLLAHPNIVRVHDLHEDAGVTFLTMEYIDGINLWDYQHNQTQQVVPWEVLAPWAAQLCEVLAYAHGENVIHRDLKPANIMVDRKGRIKLADFGIAATLSETMNHATRHMPHAGTLNYMGPQQMDGLLPHPSDDIYSLGATLYQLLTGRPPFFGEDVYSQVKQSIPPLVSERLRELNVENPVPREAEAALAQCMAKHREDRPASVRELAKLLGVQSATDTTKGKPKASEPPTEPVTAPNRISLWLQNAYQPLISLAHHKKRWLPATVLGGITALLGLMFWWPPQNSAPVRWSYDWTTALLSHPAENGVVLVYMDEESHKALAQPPNAPWDRNLHARLIDRLNRAGAKSIVFDIVFDQPGPNPTADAALEKAISVADNVVLCGAHSTVADDGKGTSQLFDLPLQRFADQARAWGLADMQMDADLTIRTHPLPVESYPPLSWAAAETLGEKPVTPSHTRWLRYYGSEGSLPNVSYYKALSSQETTDDTFRDKIVIVGARQTIGFSGAGKDTYRHPTAYGEPALVSGVEVQATALLNLLRHDWLVRLPVSVELVVIMLLGGIFGYFFALVRPLASLLLLVVASALILLIVWSCLLVGNLWFPFTLLLGQAVFAAAAGMALYALRSQMESRVLERALSVHLPTRRLRQILREGKHLTPGTEKREVTLLYSNIADFHLIADRMVPEKLHQRISTYFTDLVSGVHETGGAVMRLTGDGVFAVWNAPEEQARHQELACRAALDILKRLQTVTNTRIDFPFRTQIGIHFGAVAVGNLGNEDRMDYMAVGLNVHLASSLASLNKELGTQIIATENVASATGKVIAFRILGWFRLPGQQRAIEVYEVLGLRTDPVAREWSKTFEDSLGWFREHQFDYAESGFQRVLTIRPGDGPSLFYLQQIKALQQNPPPQNWFGEIELATR